jgi:hypothetical protein
MAGFANRIVRDDVENQILGAVVDALVRLAGAEDECVARFDGRRATAAKACRIVAN